MSSLVYQAINSDITYTNVLLIDSTVPDFQSVYDSVNDETLPIVYSNSSSKVQLLTLLNTNFKLISRLNHLIIIHHLCHANLFINSKSIDLINFHYH